MIQGLQSSQSSSNIKTIYKLEVTLNDMVEGCKKEKNIYVIVGHYVLHTYDISKQIWQKKRKKSLFDGNGFDTVGNTRNVNHIRKTKKM